MHSIDRINVLVAHENPLVAAGLAATMNQQADFEVILHPVSPGGPAEYWRTRSFDAVVADYWCAMDLMATTARSGRRPQVVIVSAFDRETEVRSALEAGVAGYMLLDCSLGELVNGVRLVGRGSRYLCSAVAARIADSLTRRTLTNREIDVLQLIAAGCCNKAIAKSLGIAVGTVKAHVKAILEKLDANSRTHAVAIATGRGLVARNRKAAVAGAAPDNALDRRAQLAQRSSLSLVDRVAPSAVPGGARLRSKSVKEIKSATAALAGAFEWGTSLAAAE
ncbi:MAG TPA: response regulator transcription factor [Usitatibacteraceae bacterium]